MTSPRLALVLALLPACAAASRVEHRAWSGAVAPLAEAAVSPEPVPAAELAGLPPAQDDDATPGSADFRAISLHVGLRQFDEDDWEPIEEQVALAVEFVSQSAGAIAGFEAGFSYSTDDDDFDAGGVTLDAEAEVFEVYAGVHKSFLDSMRVRPYVGAGLTYLQGEIELSGGGGSADDDDDVFGVYLHGGLGLPLNDRLEAGVDVRTIFADDFDVFGNDADADYAQASVFLGLRI